MLNKTRVFLPALCVLLAGCTHDYWSGNPTVKGSGNPTVKGSGNIVSETRPVHDFASVSVSGSGSLLIIQDNQESLTVTADDNLLPFLKTEVTGDELKIGPHHVNLHPSKSIRYELHLKNLRQLHLSGSLSARAESLSSDTLVLTVSGSGDIRVSSLSAQRLKVRVTGSGGVTLAGKANQQDIRISGSGTYRAADLQSEDASVHLSGSGDATLWLSGGLDAHLTGSGRVDYYGTPQVATHISGSGRAHSLGPK